MTRLKRRREAYIGGSTCMACSSTPPPNSSYNIHTVNYSFYFSSIIHTATLLIFLQATSCCNHNVLHYFCAINNSLHASSPQDRPGVGFFCIPLASGVERGTERGERRLFCLMFSLRCLGKLYDQSSQFFLSKEKKDPFAKK